MSGRLKKVTEYEVEDHINYIRTGHRARTDDPNPVPTQQELADAGFRRPPRPRAKGAEPGPSAKTLIENEASAKWREIRGLEVNLDHALHTATMRINGENRQARIRGLQAKIERLRAEIDVASAPEAAQGRVCFSATQTMTMDERNLRRAARLMSDVLAAGRCPTTSMLSDGSTGWHMRRVDDCWASAVATCLRVAYDEVPDARIDQQLSQGVSPKLIDQRAERDMARWLDRRGLTLVEHDALPTHLGRWIGSLTSPAAFQSHTLVMVHNQILFDPNVRPGVRTFYSLEGRSRYRLQFPEEEVTPWHGHIKVAVRRGAEFTSRQTNRKPSAMKRRSAWES